MPDLLGAAEESVNTPKSPSEEPVSDLKPASKRSWRVRWSMRAFFVLVTLTCILFAWGSYLARVGQTHEEVANQLAVLGKATPTYAHRRSRIDVQWKYTVKVTKQTISGRTWNRITSSPTNIVLQTQYEKGVPKWMENTQTGLLFQRIDTIESKGPLRPEELEEFLGLVARLDRLESLRLGEYRSGANDKSATSRSIVHEGHRRRQKANCECSSTV
ncbi:hypothetical protein [Bremerella sp. P1]|uniref:hypothetical protein n=1 Tax=Bremerella sp. P1 TaxID=3026424 RepID=UPI0023674728|nr:hypothetical protein [Bremerella sp. P1]WDI44213.1 hypothetical protein PSR63_09740 [Bremerella sp. P1]